MHCLTQLIQLQFFSTLFGMNCQAETKKKKLHLKKNLFRIGEILWWQWRLLGNFLLLLLLSTRFQFRKINVDEKTYFLSKAMLQSKPQLVYLAPVSLFIMWFQLSKDALLIAPETWGFSHFLTYLKEPTLPLHTVFAHAHKASLFFLDHFSQKSMTF